MADRDLQDVIELLGRTSTDLGTMADDFSRPQGQPHSSQRNRGAGNPELTRALEELLRKKALPGDGSSSEQDVAMGGFSGAASLPAQTSEPGPIEAGARSGGDVPDLLNYRYPSPIDAKAETRARNLMEKRRLREEMTGEPQPGLGYEETLTQERIKVEREVEEGVQKRKSAEAAGGMSMMDVLGGKAPPKVGGEFVFPPGDMSKSPAYQKAKAEADAATEGQIVAEIPDDEQLGGTSPEDTPPAEGPDEGGSLPTDDVQGPGDLRRLSAQRKLGQLHNLRSIAEGGMRMGNIPVQGDFSGTGPPRPFVTGQPQQAEGIRAEIGRVTADESLFLKSQLRREEQTSLFQDRAREERLKARLENLGVGPNNLTMRQSDALWKDREVWIKGATYVKANEALAAVRAGLESLKDIDGAAPPGQAQMLAARQLLKAYGEGSRMSDYDLKSIIYSPQFKGMYDRAYLFVTGKTTPKTVKLYKEMLTKLDGATKAHFNNVRQKRAESFRDHWGVPVDVVLKTYGSLFDEGDTPKAAPEGNQIRMTKDGVEAWKMEKDEEAWQRAGWSRAP